MDRHALSARGVEREYQIGRDRVIAAVRAGELPAARLGARRILILRTDLERWIRAHTIRPTTDARVRVDEVLAREAGRAAG